MTPEDRELLNKVVEMTEDNNRILHGIRRSMRWASVMRAIYWIVLIGTSVGAFWLIQPYLNALTGSYAGAQSDMSNIQDLIKQYTQ